MKATKNICCANGEGTFDYSSVTKWMKKLCIYVTAIKPNLHERFRADNGKNRNMPTKRMKTSLSGYALLSYIFNGSNLRYINFNIWVMASLDREKNIPSRNAVHVLHLVFRHLHA